jgi:hypothetical protein
VAQLNAINAGGGCTSQVSSSACSASINCGGELNETITVSGKTFTGTVDVAAISPSPACSYDVAGTVQ